MSDNWQDRLVLEHTELVGRLNKLEAFMDTDKYDMLSIEDMKLLQRQGMFMDYYLNILDQRIKKLQLNC